MAKRQVKLLSPKEKGQRIVAAKPMRNALCHCGSGIKQKHCCGDETHYASANQLNKLFKNEDSNNPGESAGV